ncbi:three-Cys-motif partner protein TcmP [Rhodovulum sulfidophilum]|uniref:three-Cys-motif partner protein TcmP n=1 Tax=Rhodovulum sulfidophilum TaxID=35806 RepID=UPI0019214A67|nr:three-Cys-motif partner protein TcmP [Rhodovulum sulfidophilum]MBL3562652.1 three-Cys-motif partner protein TcmP [Rhodovulum sulfidophilum]
MVKRQYDWENGAKIGPHSKIKLEIIKEYIHEYVRVRCSLPQQERFRLSFVDGFCGAGSYECGTLGSPLMAMQTLKSVSAEVNLRRKVDGFKPISFEFYMYFNDLSSAAIQNLQGRVDAFLQEHQDESSGAIFCVKYFEGDFGRNLPSISQMVLASRVRNTIFNLDQYGHADVSEDHLRAALALTRSSEVFLTFSIKSFLAFISPAVRQDTRIFDGQISDISLHKTKKEWLAAVEKVVFEEFQTLANFVSPFSINNQNGWEYWLVHFANSFRARQVYNDILHRKKNSQAHVGRSGLQMLRYNSIEDASLYLFDANSRRGAREELLADIPKFLKDCTPEASLSVAEFFGQTYNQTPAHSDDLNSALIKSPEVEILTAAGGKRRKPQMIKRTDTIRLTRQRSFHFL